MRSYIFIPGVTEQIIGWLEVESNRVSKAPKYDKFVLESTRADIRFKTARLTRRMSQYCYPGAAAYMLSISSSIVYSRAPLHGRN